jgi:hypothetical protein
MDGKGLGASDAVFGDESKLGIGALSAFGEQGLEGAADGAFVIDVELAELVEGGIVVLDGGVGRLESDRHLCGASLQRDGGGPHCVVKFSGLWNAGGFTEADGGQSQNPHPKRRKIRDV